MSRRAAAVLLGLLAVFWGLNWPVMKLGLEEVPPWVFRAVTSTSGGVGLLLVARLGGLALRVPPREAPGLLICALLNITGWNVLVLYGVAEMNSGRAGIIAYTMPLWATIAGVMVLGERPGARGVAALAIGMGGVALLFPFDDATGWRGPGYVLLAAMFWGAGTVAVKHYRFSMPVTVLVAWQHLVGALPIAVVALVWDADNVGTVGLVPALSVLYNMTVTAVFCYWAYFKVVSALPVAVSTVGTLMVPVLGVLFTALIYREAPQATDYVALAAVAVAIALVMTPGRRPRG